MHLDSLCDVYTLHSCHKIDIIDPRDETVVCLVTKEIYRHEIPYPNDLHCNGKGNRKDRPLPGAKLALTLEFDGKN